MPQVDFSLCQLLEENIGAPITNFAVELCDTNKNHVIYPTEATIQRAIELCLYLMNKYNIDSNHVIRHFDVTGKQCPAYWIENAIWEAEFHSKISIGSEISSLYNKEQGVII